MHADLPRFAEIGWSAMTERSKHYSRRNFLLTVGAGGAATAAAIAAKRSGPSQQPSSGSGRRTSRGYQVSEHIDNYYRTTKV